jgi:acyl-CoA thioesterase I
MRLITLFPLSAILLLAVLWVTTGSRAAAQTPAPGTVSAPAPAPAAAPALSHEQQLLLDWPQLARYHTANVQLAPAVPGEDRVVFYGDSITDGWHLAEYFPGKPYVNRGISGQTTPQMLVRFRQDVVALQPKVVVILAGTNDIAGNTGPTTLEAIEDNFVSMAELARANSIRVVFASVLPAYDYPWKPGMQPVEKIAALNAWLKNYAAANSAVYLDYYSAMQDERHGLPAKLSHDGVHPNPAGYAVMQPLAEQAIEQALQSASHQVQAQ